MVTWIKADTLPPFSTAMQIKPVLVWCDGRAQIGWYLGGYLNEWRVSGSNNAQEVMYWSPLNSPAKETR